MKTTKRNYKFSLGIILLYNYAAGVESSKLPGYLKNTSFNKIIKKKTLNIPLSPAHLANKFTYILGVKFKIVARKMCSFYVSLFNVTDTLTRRDSLICSYKRAYHLPSF